IIDGDILIALIAEKLHNEGRLKKDLVIITQMSNMALEEYLNYIGVSTIRTNIGDRYVLEEMKKQKCNFGAEQSGHIVLSDYSTTGDGLIASLQILEILANQQQKISDLKKIFTLNPQILVNLKFQSTINPLQKNEVQDFIKQQQEIIGKSGRILVRKSGTENLIRIMV
ncbi:MAG: phosphoglucosamine mutase, partial [Alphaproteobacteria bacterium]